jgi:hypothetical protein
MATLTSHDELGPGELGRDRPGLSRAGIGHLAGVFGSPGLEESVLNRASMLTWPAVSASACHPSIWAAGRTSRANAPVLPVDLCTKTSFADKMGVELQMQWEGHDGWSSEEEFRIA